MKSISLAILCYSWAPYWLSLPSDDLWGWEQWSSSPSPSSSSSSSSFSLLLFSYRVPFSSLTRDKYHFLHFYLASLSPDGFSNIHRFIFISLHFGEHHTFPWPQHPCFSPNDFFRFNELLDRILARYFVFFFPRWPFRSYSISQSEALHRDDQVKGRGVDLPRGRKFDGKGGYVCSDNASGTGEESAEEFSRSSLSTSLWRSLPMRQLCVERLD